MACLCYNYDPNVTSTATYDNHASITFDFNSSAYSSTYISLPPDEVEEEKVKVLTPWLWLLPWDPGEPAVRRAPARPPRRPARCRDPPG